MLTVVPQCSDITASQVETDPDCALTQMIGETELTVSQDLRRRWEGQLNKFTNVVKGWQYRWFVLEPECGKLEYFLLEEKSGRCRGSQHLAGGVVLPSEEDSQTFTINFATGEVWKVRASHAKERQMWVDRLRASSYLHSSVLSSTNSLRQDTRPPTPPGSKSHFANGQPGAQLQNLSLSVLDAFGSVHDILNKVDKEHQAIVETIEAFPLPRKCSDSKVPGSPTCHDTNLLQLKATAGATVRCMETALSILQELRGTQLEPPIVVHQSIPLPSAFSNHSVTKLPGSPAHRTFSSLSIPGTPSRKLRTKPVEAIKIP